MADNYVIRKATLDGIAAQTMTLNGTTAAMTTEQMEQAVADANTEVTTQAAKIAELSTILDGKAGGSGGAEIETCTVTVTVGTDDARIAYTQYVNDEYVAAYCDGSTVGVTIETPIGNSLFVVYPSAMSINVEATGAIAYNSTYITTNNVYIQGFTITDSIASISVTTNSGGTGEPGIM